MLKQKSSLILKGLFGSFCLLLLNFIFYFIMIFISITFDFLYVKHIFCKTFLHEPFTSYLAIIISTLIARKLFKNISKELLITTMFFYSFNLFFIAHTPLKHIPEVLFATLFVYFMPDIISKGSKFLMNCKKDTNNANY